MSVAADPRIALAGWMGRCSTLLESKALSGIRLPGSASTLDPAAHPAAPGLRAQLAIGIRVFDLAVTLPSGDGGAGPRVSAGGATRTLASVGQAIADFYSNRTAGDGAAPPGGASAPTNPAAVDKEVIVLSMRWEESSAGAAPADPAAAADGVIAMLTRVLAVDGGLGDRVAAATSDLATGTTLGAMWATPTRVLVAPRSAFHVAAATSQAQEQLLAGIAATDHLARRALLHEMDFGGQLRPGALFQVLQIVEMPIDAGTPKPTPAQIAKMNAVFARRLRQTDGVWFADATAATFVQSAMLGKVPTHVLPFTTVSADAPAHDPHTQGQRQHVYLSTPETGAWQIRDVETRTAGGLPELRVVPTDASDGTATRRNTRQVRLIVSLGPDAGAFLYTQSNISDSIFRSRYAWSLVPITEPMTAGCNVGQMMGSEPASAGAFADLYDVNLCVRNASWPSGRAVLWQYSIGTKRLQIKMVRDAALADPPQPSPLAEDLFGAYLNTAHTVFNVGSHAVVLSVSNTTPPVWSVHEVTADGAVIKQQCLPSPEAVDPASRVVWESAEAFTLGDRNLFVLCVDKTRRLRAVFPIRLETDPDASTYKTFRIGRPAMDVWPLYGSQFRILPPASSGTAAADDAFVLATYRTADLKTTGWAVQRITSRPPQVNCVVTRGVDAAWVASILTPYFVAVSNDAAATSSATTPTNDAAAATTGSGSDAAAFDDAVAEFESEFDRLLRRVDDLWQRYFRTPLPGREWIRSSLWPPLKQFAGKHGHCIVDFAEEYPTAACVVAGLVALILLRLGFSWLVSLASWLIFGSQPSARPVHRHMDSTLDCLVREVNNDAASCGGTFRRMMGVGLD